MPHYIHPHTHTHAHHTKTLPQARLHSRLFCMIIFFPYQDLGTFSVPFCCKLIGNCTCGCASIFLKTIYILFIFWPQLMTRGIFPNHRWNPCWNRVLTTGPPGKSRRVYLYPARQQQWMNSSLSRNTGGWRWRRVGDLGCTVYAEGNLSSNRRGSRVRADEPLQPLKFIQAEVAPLMEELTHMTQKWLKQRGKRRCKLVAEKVPPQADAHLEQRPVGFRGVSWPAARE